jgi:hypothetical protein
MDVASAILALQMQIEDNEGILAALDCSEDYHAALILHIFDLRERLQVLQDHSVAYRPLGALGQETLDGIFGPYHTLAPIEEQLQSSPPIPADPKDALEADQPADPEPQPELSESTDAVSQEAEQDADLRIDPDARESTDPPTSTPSSALSSSKRKAGGPAGQEGLGDPKRRKLRDDAQGDASMKSEVPSQDSLALVSNPDLAANEDAIIVVRSNMQRESSSDPFHHANGSPTVSEAPAGSACIACLAVFAEESLIQCPCDHKYCVQCLTEHFRAGIQGVVFPPSCCYEEIPLELVRPHLSAKLQANYAAKKLAIDKPGTVHCALLSCQALIAPENISNGRATCVCNTITCVGCKFIAHDDACPEESKKASLLRLAVTKGLCACYRCGELYDREFGCNPMTYMHQYQDTFTRVLLISDIAVRSVLPNSATIVDSNGRPAVVVPMSTKLGRSYVREKWLTTVLSLFLLL